jgi:pyruvate/2-oxoglutarate dehydrogenase complex dihydrolipoamide dehydrogenase (E3) component
MVSPSASEAIQGFALAMKKGLYKRDLDGLVGVHPTVTEALLNGSLVITKSSGKDPKSKGC